MGGRSPILTDCNVGNRLTPLPIPNNDGFSLIGNADRLDIAPVSGSVFQGSLYRLSLRFPDFFCIVLSPTWLGEKFAGVRSGRHLQF